MTHPITLRAGDHGAAVAALQVRLRAAGHGAPGSAWYDAATEACVCAFQSDHGMVVDGIAGPRTQAALVGRLDPKDLTERDIQRAAEALGCAPAAIHAVIEVESPSDGFLPDGRVTILFERHVFWQQLKQAGVDPSTVALPANVLSRERGGYIGGAAEYARLAQAAAINREAAHAACSWGRFQIMGYHAHTLGYADAQAMAAAFATGEAEHLAAFVRFVAADDALRKALDAGKWSAFAKAYNGPAYAQNLYDVRLARAFARYRLAEAA